MSFEQLSSYTMRLFFWGAFVLLVAAAGERLANTAGYTVLRGSFDPGRLLELAVILLVFVIAILMRQVRDRLPGG